MKPPAEAEFLRTAESFLARDDITRVANKMRQDFAEGIERPLACPVDNELADAVTRAKSKLIPNLCDLYAPARIPSTKFLHLNLAQSWIAAYLDEAKYTTARLGTLRRRSAQLLLMEARDTHILTRVVLALPGFKCEREFFFFASVNDTLFKCGIRRNARPMEPWSYSYNVRAFAYVHERFPDSSLMSEWVIVVDSMKERNPTSYITFGHPEADDVTSRVILALRLFKDDRLRAPATFPSQKTLYLAAYCKSIRAAEMGPAWGDYTLKREERDSFVHLAKWVIRLPLNERLPPSLRIALDYFQTSYAKWPPGEFLDLAIALEALCKIGQEQTYRLPLRLSALLARTKDAAEVIYAQVRELWKVRNELAHGNPKQNQPKYRAKLKGQTSDLRNIVRRTILAHLRRLRELAFDRSVYEREFGKEFETRYVVGRGLPQIAR